MKKLILITLLLSYYFQSFAQLNGVYTIGGSNPDYYTITEANQELNNLGISGAVIFNIRNGIYQEYLTFKRINGADSLNTITFISESLDSSSVTIQWQGQSITLDSACYYNFKHLNLKSISTTLGRVVKFGSGTHHILFENNKIEGTSAVSSVFDARLVEFWTSQISDYNIFRANRFIGGTQGLFIYGHAAKNAIGSIVENNIFENQSYGGAVVQYQNTAIIRNNIVISESIKSSYDGLKLGTCNKNSQIVNNKISIKGGHGINVSNSDGESGNDILILNNMISSDNTLAYSAGLYIYWSNFITVAHNSINIYGNNILGYGASIKSTSIDKKITLLNNNFCNKSGGPAIRLESYNPLTFSDNNNFYAEGQHLAILINDSLSNINEWQIATSKDFASLSVNPVYYSDIDLHSNSPQLDKAGFPLYNIVPKDIDNEDRDAISPDIGADEFVASCMALLYNKKDVTCNGGNDGSISITIIGGGAPYTISWSNNDTTSNLDNLTAGTYYLSITDTSNCVVNDSIIVSAPEKISYYNSISICSSDSILLGGDYQNQIGTYNDTLNTINGCDSIIITTLDILPNYSILDFEFSICNNDSVLVYGAYRNISGIYSDSLLSIDGCDSIRYSILTVIPSYYNSTTVSICNYDSVLIFGVYRKQAGMYIDSSYALNGCDSINAINLIINPTYYTHIDEHTICYGDSISIFNTYQDIQGIYYDTLKSVSGCDSILAISLIILPDYQNILNEQVICEGDSILIFNNYQQNEGIYFDTLSSIYGCDSILSISLYVDPKPFISILGLDSSYCSSDEVVVILVNPQGGLLSGQGLANNLFDPSVVEIGTHEITYTYIDSNTCLNSITQQVTILACTGIENFEEESSINVFPNPSSGNFEITYQSDQNFNIAVTIYNNLGQQVFFEEKINTSGSYQKSVDAKILSAGTYYIQIMLNETIYYRKIIIN